MSTPLPGNKLPELRKRIIQIAASYVGQSSIVVKKKVNGKDLYFQRGFHDPVFEKKMKGIGWFKDSEGNSLAWCNTFCRLVYKEALLGGNSIITNVPKPGTWIEKGVGSYLGIPVTFPDGRTDITKWVRKAYGAFDPTVTNTRGNFTNMVRFVDITKNKTPQSDLLKKYWDNNTILPGDCFINAAGPKAGSTSGSHIGIFIAPTNNFKSIITIEGNYSRKCKYNVRKIGGNTAVAGFTQLVVSPNY